MAFNLLEYARNRERDNKTPSSSTKTPSASAGGFSLIDYAAEKEGRGRNTTPAVSAPIEPKVSFAQNQYTYTPAYTDTGSSNYSREDVLRLLADNKIAQEQANARAKAYSPDMSVVKPSNGGVEAYTDAGSRNISRDQVERLNKDSVLAKRAEENLLKEYVQRYLDSDEYKYENMGSEQLRSEWSRVRQNAESDLGALQELLTTDVPFDMTADNIANYGGPRDEALQIIANRDRLAEKYGLDTSSRSAFYKSVRDAISKLDGDVAYYDGNGNPRTYANLYYDVQNKEKFASLEDPQRIGIKRLYDAVDTVDGDLTALDYIVRGLENAQVRADDAAGIEAALRPYQGNIDAIRERYGVDIINSPEMIAQGWGLLNKNAAAELKSSLENRRDENKQLLSRAGYDYDRMAEYKKRQFYSDWMEKVKKEAAEWATQNFGTGLLATLDNIISGIFEAGENLQAAASGSGEATPEGADTYIPIDTSRRFIGNWNQSATSAVTNAIDEGLGGGVLGWLVSRGYSGVTSVAHSLVTIGAARAMFGPAAGEAVGLFILGSESGLRSVVDSAERGLNNDKAILTGIAAGINETLFEKLSFDRFLKVGGGWDKKHIAESIKRSLKELGLQGLVEGSEELFTDLANDIADAAINADQSEYYANVRKYMNQGMSEEDARLKATGDFAMQIAESFYGGFVGGGISAGGKLVWSAVTNSDFREGVKFARDMRNAAKDVTKGLDLDDDIVKKISRGEELTDGEIQTIIADPKTQFAVEELTGIKINEGLQQNRAGEYVSATVDPQQVRNALTLWFYTQAPEATPNTQTESPYQRITLPESNAEQTLTQIAEEAVAPTEPQVAPTATAEVQTPVEAESVSQIASENKNAKNEEITAPAETQMQTVNSENRRAWDALAAEYGEKGAEMMRGLYDDELDYLQLDAIARDFSAYYNAGVDGKGLMDVESAAKVEAFNVFDRDSDALTSMEIAAYEAGQQDAGLISAPEDAIINTTENEGGAEYGGEQGQSIRDGRGTVRGVVQRSGGQAGAVYGEQSEGPAGRKNNDGRGTGAESRGSSGVSEKARGQRVSPKELGIPQGIADQDLVITTKADSYGYRHLSRFGVDYTSVAGEIKVNDGGKTFGVGGVQWSEGGKHKVVTRSDSSDFTEEQLARHEQAHFEIQSGRVDIAELSGKVIDLAGGDEEVRELLRAYYDGYGDTYNAAGIIEELIADAKADMDRYGVEGAKSAMDTLRRAFGKVYEQSRGSGTKADGDGVAFSRSEGYRDYSKPITAEDVRELRSIGRKDINDFTPADLQKAQKWAYKFYKEFGEKSPFFRAWFGEWRAHDKGKLSIVDTVGDTRSPQYNTDTGWVINASKFVHKETSHHSGSSERNAVKYLPYIDDITRKAVLLETSTSDNDNPNSIMFHTMYAYTEILGHPALLRLRVEELYSEGHGNKDIFKRDYILQSVNEESLSSRSRVSNSNHGKMPSSPKSISDLYDLVKTFDKDFHPGKPVNPAMLNADGTPKVVYHGTDADFTVFDETKGRSTMDIQGMFFSPWELDAKGYGPNVGAYYLSLKNPAPEGVAYKALNMFKGQNDAGVKAREYLEKLGYDGVNNSDEEYIAFYPTQIKSATDNIGTFDKTNPDVRYSRSIDEDLADAYADLRKQLAEANRKLANEMGDLNFSNRELLANALETVTKDGVEAQFIERYREEIETLNETEAELKKVRAELRKEIFSQSRDDARIEELTAQRKHLENKLNYWDKKLMTAIEASKPLQRVVERERARAYKRAREQERAKVDALREGRELREAQDRLLKMLRRINNKKLSTPNKAWLEQHFGDIYTLSKTLTGKKLAAAEDIKNRIAALTDENSPDYDPNYAPSPRLLARLQEITEKKTDIASMDLDEVYDRTALLMEFAQTIENSKKLAGVMEKREIHDLAYHTITDIATTKGNESDLTEGFKRMLRPFVRAGEAAADFVNTEVLPPIASIQRYTGFNDNDPLYQRAEDLAKAEGVYDKYTTDANALFDELLNDKQFVKFFRGDAGKPIVFKARGVGGDGMPGGEIEVQITPALRTWLYLNSLNADNLNHIKTGGAIFPDLDLLRKGKYADAFNEKNSKRVLLNPEEIKRITAGMTAKEMQFARAWAKYESEMAQPGISRVHEDQYGTPPKMVDEGYFMIRTKMPSSSAIDGLEQMQIDGTTDIGSPGWLKERKDSKLPIYAYPADMMIKRAIDDHARFVAYSIPVSNFNKIWNANMWGKDSIYNPVTQTDETMFRLGTSVQDTLKAKWGQNAIDVVQQMLDEYVGKPRGKNSKAERVLNKIRGNYAQARLAAGFGTALKQMPSGIAAAPVIDFRSLAKAANPGYSIDTSFIDDYTAAYSIRKKGYSSTELGDLAKQGKRLPKWLIWYQTADLVTTGPLLKRAAAFYVRRNFKTLEVGSEAYKQKVAEVYDKIINETQPTYDVMYRANALRNPSPIWRALNMFKTQPYKNYTILYTALGNLRAKGNALNDAEQFRYTDEQGKAEYEQARNEYTEAKKRVVRAFVSQILSGLAISAIMVLNDFLVTGNKKKYQDEDGDVTLFSFLKGLGLNFASTGAGMFPLGGAILETVENTANIISGNKLFDTYSYGLKVPEVETLNNVQSTIDKLVEALAAVADAEDASDWEKIGRALWKTAVDTGEIFGIPSGNLNKTLKAALRQVFRTQGKYVGEYLTLRVMGTVDAYKQAHYDNLYKAYKNDKAQYQEIYNNLIDNGVTEKAIKDAMESRMKKEQGVSSVKELKSRYFSPTQQKEYDKTVATVKQSNVYYESDSSDRARLNELAYEVTATDGWKNTAAVKDNNLNATEYVLYQLALDIVDQPNSKGNYGTYTKEETEKAIEMVKGN